MSTNANNANTGADPYENFRTLLQKNVSFPCNYTFKFIVKVDDQKHDQVLAVFAGTDAQITENNSSQGKYRSFSVVVPVKDEEEVITFYKEVSKIESVIML
ncbi:DUF493 domain-containing protein [Chitinophaga sp. sic0106]|uniref:HP0495 family protein n=1 Tax=Chitinophaga sp. sic0106 TaxID=2854785 RepID=UPI001C486CBA|nr:DUF493 domain-containing protein [Chitinophaga sp. sic0106]MBV7532522.1 DUF493 domain-containing protein [Chitinophaga sp. sic0106]